MTEYDIWFDGNVQGRNRGMLNLTSEVLRSAPVLDSGQGRKMTTSKLELRVAVMGLLRTDKLTKAELARRTGAKPSMVDTITRSCRRKGILKQSRPNGGYHKADRIQYWVTEP